MKHLAVGVAGMSCQGCVKNVTSVLQALPGVPLNPPGSLLGLMASQSAASATQAGA